MNIRRAIAADAPEIIEVIDSAYAYGIDRTSDRWETWRRIVANGIGHWWVLLEGQRIAGVCKAGCRPLMFGAATMRSAEVSELCVLPKMQRKGLGNLLLGHVIGQMRNAGIAFSRLTARRLDLAEFYRRHGYAPFPTRDVELCPESDLPLPAERKERIRPFDADRDLSACAELYNDFNRRFMGSLIWQTPQGAWSDRYRLVYAEGDHLAAYCYACDSFGQVAYRDGREDAFQALLRQVNNQARQDGMGGLQVKLPWSDDMAEVLQRSGIPFACRERWPNTMINMVRFISLESLFSQILPELEHRLQQFHWPPTEETIEIATRSDSIQIEVRDGKMRIAHEHRPSFRLELEQVYLLKAVLGAGSFWDVCTETEVPLGVRTLLGVIFPRMPVTGGSEVWGPDSYDLTAHPLTAVCELHHTRRAD